MNTAFKKMTRAMAWLTTASLTIGFAMMPTGAAAIEFFPTPFRYQWKAQNGTVESGATVVRVQKGDTVQMSLTVTNRSIDPKAQMIYGKSTLSPEAAPYQGAHELRLGTAKPHDNIPGWIDPSSFIANPDGAANRFAVYDGAAVNKGEDLTFSFPLKISATASDGTYDLYVGMVREFDAWAKPVDSVGRLLASEDIFWRVIVGAGGTVIPATGGLTMALASGTPVGHNVAKSGNDNFTKFNMTAASGATVSISSIYVTRTGLSADTDLENIKILDANGVQVGNTSGGFDNNSRAQIFFSPQLDVVGSNDYFIRAGFASAATTGLTAALGIATNSDIVGNATSVTGAPVTGNFMTAVAVTIGTISVTEDGSVADTTPDVGEKDVVVNTFKITAGSTEGIDIDRITVIKAGTSDVGDTNNIELWDVTNSKTLGTATTWTADGKASWPVAISLAKGNFIRLRVQLDIVDGVSLTVNADLADGSDYLVFGKGKLYGFYITPTAAAAANWGVQSGGSNNLGQGDYNQTINSGAVTVSKSASTPPTGNIAVGDAKLLAVWDWQILGEQTRISDVIVRGDLTNAGGSTTITYADMTNAYLVNMTTGDILFGPVDGADGLAVVGTTAVDPKFTYSSTYVFPVGTTQVGFKVRLGTDWEASDTIAMQLYQAGDMTCKGVQSNNTITPTGFASAGNTMTIKAGALVVRMLGNPPTGAVIKGAQDFTWATFAFDATASGEDVLITAVIITDTLDGTTGNMADIDNAELWADLDGNGSYETKISNTEQPTGGGGATDTQTFTLTQTVTVPKGGKINWIMVADLAAGTVTASTNTHCMTVVADGATATGADTGTAITDTASGASGTMTATAVGTINMALDGSNPTSAIMLAGTTNNTVAKWKLTAVNEPMSVTKITLLLADWGSSMDNWDSIKNLTIEYPRQDGTTGTRSVSPSTTTAVYDNLDMYIGKNLGAVVTAKADFYEIASESADFGDQIEVGFDYGAGGTEFAAVGLSSGTAVTAAGAADSTSSTHVLYKTMLTVVADNAGLTSALTPGISNTLYKFKTTADSRGPAALKKLTFQVSVTDAGTSNCNVNVGGFTLTRDSVDITASKVLIAGLGGMTGSVSNSTADARTTMETKGTNDVAGTGSGSGTVGTVTTWVFAEFGTTNAATQPETGDESISAGATVSWNLSGTTGANFAAADDDSIAVELLGDTTAPTDGYFKLGDDDVTDDEYSVVLALTAVGTTDTTDVEFIWSDNSAISHLGTMADNAGTVDTTPDSSGDWANGWLIKNFPLGARSIIA